MMRFHPSGLAHAGSASMSTFGSWESRRVSNLVSERVGGVRPHLYQSTPYAWRSSRMGANVVRVRGGWSHFAWWEGVTV